MNTKWYGRDREYDRNGWKMLFKWYYVRRHGNHETKQKEGKRSGKNRTEREKMNRKKTSITIGLVIRYVPLVRIIHT